MKVIVAIKRVIDHNIKIRVSSDQKGVDLTNVKMAINPFCEIAVEEAVRLKDKGVATEVVVVSVGSSSSQEQLRAALALGADRAILVESDLTLEPLAIAKVLANVVEEEKPQLVILGKQSIDSDNNQTGQMLAALCSMPQATFACDLEIGDGKAKVTREIDGGLQSLELELPAVVTSDLRLNEPRYASLPNIMKAKRKPLAIKPLENYEVDVKAKTTLLKVEAPSERQSGELVSSVSELVEKLTKEAKVI